MIKTIKFAREYIKLLSNSKDIEKWTTKLILISYIIFITFV